MFAMALDWTTGPIVRIPDITAAVHCLHLMITLALLKCLYKICGDAKPHHKKRVVQTANKNVSVHRC